MSNYVQFCGFSSAGSMENTKRLCVNENSKIGKLKKKTPDDTNKIVENIAQCVWPEGDRKLTTSRLNRNVLYAQVNALLVKKNHFQGLKLNRDIELSRDIKLNLNRGEFLILVRTDGRFVAISEEAEVHLGKNMRALYSQCINIFDCLDEFEGGKLKKMFESSQNDFGQEHRLVCSLRLPKGKRPSRVREDVTTIIMTGHFYSCHFPSTSNEKLFVARCQPLVSPMAIKTNSSSYSSTNFEISLNDDMTISNVSANTEEILGYRRNEIVNHWFGRFLPSEDLLRFETNRIQTYEQGKRNEENSPKVVQDVCDIYIRNGESRLTFFYEIRAKRTRKTRPLKFDVSFQLIDPLLRGECLKHLEKDSEEKDFAQVEQVNLEKTSLSPSAKDSIVADSPTFSGCLFNFNGSSPNANFEIFSDFVGPTEIDKQFYRNFPIDQLEFDFDQIFDQCEQEREINDYFDNSLDLIAIECGFN